MRTVFHRTLFVLFGWYSNSAFALEGNLNLDLGLAGNSRVHADSLASLRTMPSTAPLLPRYQVSASAYLYPNLDYGLAGAALDSANGVLSLGILYLRESVQKGLDSSLLPGWKLPGEEIESLSLQTLTGASLAVSFLNRSLSLGMGAFYAGTSSDLDIHTHAFELTFSGGAKFSDQIIVGLSSVDILDQVDGSRIETGVRWGLLDVSGPIGARCIDQSDIYYSSGGVELDMGYSLRNGGMDFVGVGGDIPITCNFSIHGGIQKRFLDDEMRYGAGLMIENVVNSIGYDVQLRQQGDQWEHVHLISFQLRLSNAPFAPKPHI